MLRFSNICLYSKGIPIRSQLFIPSNKLKIIETSQPKSVDLLEKSGYIRQQASGIYCFLPLGVSVLEKLNSIIDKHMKYIKGQKIQMPCLTPAELWKKTNRWNTIGDELIRVKDRSGHDYCLGPTHEEGFTDLVANIAVSQKLLPLKLYQISSKYRDEIRPRSALFRSKEFVMKDMYSFDSSKEGAMISYSTVYDQYFKLFNEIQLPVVAVKASSGSMGGSHTHEFQIINETGEDNIITCSCGKVSCNIEIAKRKPNNSTILSFSYLISQIKDSINNDYSLNNIIKNLILWFNSQNDLKEQKVRLDHYIIERHVITEKKKRKKKTSLYENVYIFSDKNRTINENEIQSFFGDNVTLHSKKSLNTTDIKFALPTRLLFDFNLHEVIEFPPDNSNEINDIENISSEFQVLWGNFTDVKPGDICGEIDCPKEEGKLIFQKGIEVGQTFYLGDKYSKPMKANFNDITNALVPLEMGCYGLGVTRILQAIVQVHHKDNAIRWPLQLAPYYCSVVPLALENKQDAEDFIESILKWSPNINRDQVFIDERFKMRFTDRALDAKQLGVSKIIVVGKQWISDGLVNLTSNTIEDSFQTDMSLESLKKHFTGFNTLLQEKEIQTI